jgi:hypothetical protein
MSLVFVPLTAEVLRGWATGSAITASLPGYADTPGLRAAFGIGDEEEAERVALLAASIAGLASNGHRLVAVVEATASPRPDADPDFGEVFVATGGYHHVTALFADEPRAVEAAASAVAGLALAEAWEHPAAIQLLSEADLLWHGPGEWEVLISG